MHFKYYFFALATIGALLFSACKNSAGTSYPDTPISGVLRNPDSVRIYKMSVMTNTYGFTDEDEDVPVKNQSLHGQHSC